MKNTYTIKEAKADFTGMMHTAERGSLITITRHQKPVAYILSPQRLTELMETMEILANPQTMQAIREAESGRGKVRDAKGLPQ